MLEIRQFLRLKGFDIDSRTKLVRHQSPTYDMHDLLRRGWFETYQRYQDRPVFNDCNYLISFVGTDGTKARLIGIYSVAGSRPGQEGSLPPGCPYTEWRKRTHYYDLTRVSGYEDLENRVVIDWGPATRAWWQWLSAKEVVQLLPKGLLRPPFQDYLDFTLTYAELSDLFSNEGSNSDWRARLEAVAGVYLILATTSGAQYVGSAYGANGIWGRWAAYARNGHGGNALLKELLAKEPAYPQGFLYSILQILPKTLARSEVLKWERQYKEKLGSRAKGLNAN